MSDTLWQTIIGGIVTIFLAYFQYKIKIGVDKNSEDIKDTAEVVAETKVVAAETKDAIIDTKKVLLNTTDLQNQVIKDTHTLVNSNMGVQLEVNRKLAEEVLRLIGNDPKKKAEAEAQLSIINEEIKRHDERQAEVDQIKNKEPEKR